MNKRPVSYLQTDPRWRDKPYRVPGESSTVGSAGCGPSCAAMVIETLTGRTFTPEDACAWAVRHGYKALRQGTYYSYFKPQLAAFGIACEQMNGASLYGNARSAVHDKALKLLKEGYYLIACMGKGTWTSSGHFVLVWWADGKIRINDPNSTKDARLNGDPETFRSQVKYYWWVDARAYNNPPAPEEKEDIMTGKEIYDALREYLSEQPVPNWAKAELQEAVDLGITDGSRPMELIPRYQAAIMAKRAAELQKRQ